MRIYITKILVRGFYKQVKISIAIFILLICNSCTKTKDLPACTGNCTDVSFAGDINDISNDKPLGNVDIKVYLIPLRTGEIFFGTDYIATTGKSNVDGSFNLNTQYDTAKYRSYTLQINSKIPDGYIQYPFIIVPNSTEKPAAIATLIFNSTDLVALNHLSYGFMQKTLLQIHLHRTSPIIAGSPYLDFEVAASGLSNGTGFLQTDANKDTTVLAYTGLNIFSKISANKAISPTDFEHITDSLKCTNNSTNEIDIDY